MKVLERIVALILIMFMSSTIFASNEVIGKWRGNIIIDGDKPMFVFLDIESLTPAESVLTLKYGQPYNCSLFAQYGGSIEHVEVFYFNHASPGGSWGAEHILKKKAEIRVSITKTGKLQYDITSKGVSLQSAVLSRVE